MKLRVALKDKPWLRVDVAKPSDILEIFDPKDIVRIDACGWGVYCEDGIVKEYATWVHSDSDYPQMVYCRTCAEYRRDGVEIAHGYYHPATVKQHCEICGQEFCNCTDDMPKKTLAEFFEMAWWLS